MSLVSVFRLFLFSQLLLLSSNGIHAYDECPKSFDCGKLGKIHFPFTKAERQDCGLLFIHGCDDLNSLNKYIELEKNGTQFLLTQLQQPENVILVFDQDLNNHLKSAVDICRAFNSNTTLPQDTPLISFHIPFNVTIFRCNYNFNVIPPIGFIGHPCNNFMIYYYNFSLYSSPNHDQLQNTTTTFSSCSLVQLPLKDVPDTDQLISFLTGSFFLQVRLSDACDRCYNQTGGHCQLGHNNSIFCDKASPSERHKGKDMLARRLGISIVFAGAVVGALIIVIYCFRRNLFFDKTKLKAHKDFEAFLKRHGPLAIKRYSYSEIKNMTNSFKENLGKGGYGSVFKGMLHDKRLVAVKIVKETKGNGEDFINEVASISRTSHVNIVTLLGFCFEGSKKALVYEFMVNGSLEKFIYANQLNNPPLQLCCNTLYQIAMGVARGLEYLHRGCNTRILHFDIKPHNILLDENFFPKISDFGLAKICPGNESIVSMLCARGTIGYIAPEVASRAFGEVSHKSDVYSFGMMVLEMVGGRRNVDVEVDRTSKIYFPRWIYKRVMQNQELSLEIIRNEGEKEKMRQLVIVSLWCIQTDPSHRPMMSKVVEMLEGRIEALQMPPKPYLSSP